MKLHRSDLEQNISNQLFEISADSLDLSGIQLVGNTISCICSVETASGGYRIHGCVKTKLIECCDRCLIEFEIPIDSKFNVILTNDKTLIAEKNIDVIQFSQKEENVDLAPLVHDVILLSEPLKRLCSSTCKGICITCGKNLNESTCECSSFNGDPRWDALKKFKD